MAKKDNHKISINKFETAIEKITHTVDMPVSDGVITITIKETLSLSEALEFVQEVVASCVNKDDGTYTPDVKRFAIKYEVLTKYANFNMPSSADKQYDLIYNTDAANTVIKYINVEQFEEMCDAIDDRINHDKALIENSMAEKMSEMLVKMSEFVDNSKSLIGGISQDDIANLVKYIPAVSAMSESSIAHAVLREQAIMNDGDDSSEEKVVSIFSKQKDSK